MLPIHCFDYLQREKQSTKETELTEKTVSHKVPDFIEASLVQISHMVMGIMPKGQKRLLISQGYSYLICIFHCTVERNRATKMISVLLIMFPFPLNICWSQAGIK